MSGSYAPSGTFTRTPNILYDLLPELGNAEMRIVLAVCRETFGHHREWAELSFSDLANATGLSRQSIGDAIAVLLDLTADGECFFFRKKAGRGFTYRIDENVLESASVKQLDRSSSLTAIGQVALLVPVKLLDRSLYKEETKEKRKETKGAADSEKAKDEPTPPAFAPGSWQARYATRCLDRLTQFGLAPKSAAKRREHTVQAWAEVFDRLHRIDGFTEEDIAAVMAWLLTEDNWWIRTGNFRSAMKLRQKMRGEETTHFELFRLRRETEGAEAKAPDLTQPITAAQRDTALRLLPALTPDDFGAFGNDHRTGEAMYRLRPEGARKIAAPKTPSPAMA